MRKLLVGLMLVASILMTANFAASNAVFVTNLAADDEVKVSVDEKQAIAAMPEDPQRYLAVICGLPGDEQHRERYQSALKQISECAAPVLRVPENHIRVLVGDLQMQSAMQEIGLPIGNCAVTTRDSIADLLSGYAKKTSVNDTLLVLLLGHGHLQGASSQLNIEGVDLDQKDFAALAKGIAASQVYWLTQSTSGFWVRPLSGPGRIVIASTEAGFEITATEMPFALADVLSAKSEHGKLDDIDADGVISLVDLYLATTMEIAGRFRADDWLMTEHAQLDDNGDGRGSEIQEPYLPDPEFIEAQVTEPSRPAKPKRTFLDGDFAKGFLMNRPQ